MAIGFAVISAYLAPIMYQRIEGNHLAENRINLNDLVIKKKSIYLASFAFVLIACFFLVAFSALVHERYFQMIVPSEYTIYSDYMGIVLVAGFFTGMGEICLLKFQGDMRVIAIRNIRLISSTVGLIGNVIGAWLLGIQGVFLSILFFSLLNLLLFLASKK